MRKDVLGKCPVCGDHLEISKLYCKNCDTTIEGHFNLCKFCKLFPEQKQFIESFIKCRGNIKEVEKDLGISYPTVRSKLDDIVLSLGYVNSKVKNDKSSRNQILESLEKNEIDYDEALRLLKENK